MHCSSLLFVCLFSWPCATLPGLVSGLRCRGDRVSFMNQRRRQRCSDSSPTLPHTISSAACHTASLSLTLSLTLSLSFSLSLFLSLSLSHTHTHTHTHK